jgi:hypothetical protein
MRCQRLWAYTYIEGEREPEIPWASIAGHVWSKAAHGWVPDPSTQPKRVGASPFAPRVDASQVITSRERSASLGKAVHAVFEGWFLGHTVDWNDLPGRIAQSGAHLVPRPELCEFVVPERSIGDVALPRYAAHTPATAFKYGGLLWTGNRDLLCASESEFKRLEIFAPDGVAQVDYKSTSDIAKWALDEAELLADPQGAIYTIDVCKTLGVRAVPSRWLYLETKDVRRAQPVDALIELSRAEDTMGPCVELAHTLDAFTQVEDAPTNPMACSDFGVPGEMACPMHPQNGGRCDVQHTPGQLIQLASKGKKYMPVDPELKKKFDAMRNGQAAPAGKPAPAARRPAAPAAAAPAARAPARRPAPAPEPEPEAEAEAPAPRARAPRARAPEPVAAPEPSGETSVTIQGGNGPLTISGDKADVLEVVNALL